MLHLTWYQILQTSFWFSLVSLAFVINPEYVLMQFKKIICLCQARTKYKFKMIINLNLLIVFYKLLIKISNKNYNLYKVVLTYYASLRSDKLQRKLPVTLTTLIDLNLHNKLKFKFTNMGIQKIINVWMLYKPISNGGVSCKDVSKLFIRKSRGFSKTKYSFIRQECKNIVHFTLLLNSIFIITIFNVYMRWNFLPTNTIIILVLFIVYSLPVLLKLNSIINFYLGFTKLND